jgi:hypothetical protein
VGVLRPPRDRSTSLGSSRRNRRRASDSLPSARCPWPVTSHASVRRSSAVQRSRSAALALAAACSQAKCPRRQCGVPPMASPLLSAHPLKRRARVVVLNPHPLGGLLGRCAAYVHLPQVLIARHAQWNALALEHRRGAGFPPPIVGGLAGCRGLAGHAPSVAGRRDDRERVELSSQLRLMHPKVGLRVRPAPS